MTCYSKKSVGPSIRPFIYNTNKNAHSSVINSETIIRISDERALHPLQENEVIFSQKKSKHFRPNFRNIALLLLRY